MTKLVWWVLSTDVEEEETGEEEAEPIVLGVSFPWEGSDCDYKYKWGMCYGTWLTFLEYIWFGLTLVGGLMFL